MKHAHCRVCHQRPKRAKVHHTIAFTGRETDSVAMELGLSSDKLGWLKTELRHWCRRKACKKVGVIPCGIAVPHMYSGQSKGQVIHQAD